MLDDVARAPSPTDFQSRFRHLRDETAALAAPLSDADATVQSMPDASPAKWHLAHTTWFFETFILANWVDGYRPFDPQFGYLFNSYYEAVGARHPRPSRGMLTRPSLERIYAYRAAVDAQMGDVLARAAETPDPALADLVALGIAHEEQHQELLLTDLLDLFACSPIAPVYRERPLLFAAEPMAAIEWLDLPDGEVALGALGDGFAFDCEGPRHPLRLHGGAIANRLITNGEWRAFMAAGGYRRPEYWLSDGWALIQREGWQAPLRWRRDRDGTWREFDLHGLGAINDCAPVRHISYFEADAYARWADARLPTEAEWEWAARDEIDSADRAPRSTATLAPEPVLTGPGFDQAFDSCWQWTQDAYRPYPGFHAAAGAVGEYNGKFMSGQMSLRGGSRLTAPGHSRPSYRNFFYPHQRWQMTGLRLAKDA